LQHCAIRFEKKTEATVTLPSAKHRNMNSRKLYVAQLPRVTSPQILRGEGQRKKTDNRKQGVHLGNGRGIHQDPLFEPSLAIIGITEVRI
jgi:hypothetical protein